MIQVEADGDTCLVSETWRNIFGQLRKNITITNGDIWELRFFAPVCLWGKRFTCYRRRPDKVTVSNSIRHTLKTYEFKESSGRWHLTSRKKVAWISDHWKVVKEIKFDYWKQDFKTIVRYEYYPSGLVQSKRTYDARVRNEPEEEVTYLYEFW